MFSVHLKEQAELKSTNKPFYLVVVACFQQPHVGVQAIWGSYKLGRLHSLHPCDNSRCREQAQQEREELLQHRPVLTATVVPMPLLGISCKRDR